MIEWLAQQLDDGTRQTLSDAAFDWAGRLPAVVALEDLWRLYGLACVAVMALATASWAMWRDPGA